MTNSRRKRLRITYNNFNINEQLDEHLKQWTYTDNLSGQIDDLQITLEDVENKWLSDWFPSKGSTIDAVIEKENWIDKVIKIKIGKFEVDEIDASGPVSEIIIKALAVSESTSIRGEDKSTVWENTTLNVVASDIAKRNGLKLFYESSENPKKDRYEQENETDLVFLYRLCNGEGLCLKITNNSIVILDEADYEKKPTVVTINRISDINDEIQVINWKAKTTTNGTYKSAKLHYQNSTTKAVINASFTPSNVPKVGRTLAIKDEVSSVSEGERLCKKKLRDANKNATTVSLAVTSDIQLDAGMTVNLKKFGKFDGKYIITQVIDSPKTLQLSLRKCLEGY